MKVLVRVKAESLGNKYRTVVWSAGILFSQKLSDLTPTPFDTTGPCRLCKIAHSSKSKMRTTPTKVSDHQKERLPRGHKERGQPCELRLASPLIICPAKLTYIFSFRLGNRSSPNRTSGMTNAPRTDPT